MGMGVIGVSPTRNTVSIQKGHQRMKIQYLTCEVGSHPWERQASRGKPPRTCVAHRGAILEPRPPREISVQVVEGSEAGDPIQTRGLHIWLSNSEARWLKTLLEGDVSEHAISILAELC